MHSKSSLVKAKPIDPNLLRKLPDDHRPRDFFRASKPTQDEYNGTIEEPARSPALLSVDEKNKLASKILRAEMLGDTELALKLRMQIDQKTESEGEKGHDEAESDRRSKPTREQVLVTKVDVRSGLSYPVKNAARADDSAEPRNKKKCRRSDDYSLKDLLEMEKMTSAQDQLDMFGASSSKILTSEKTSESWTIDDVVESNAEKSGKKIRHKKTMSDFDKAVKEHQNLEQTLDSCVYCIDSRKLQRHLIVALGLKTYLCISPTEPLVEWQCAIVPMSHVSSCLQMDEDIFDEMKIWRKGLVAMCKERNLDVIFVEMAKNVQHQPHTRVEAYPVPDHIGDIAPMYFKKAILECEEEWAQNKKVINLREKELRKAVPRGFSYFAVDFGLQSGYAHVIESEARFPAHFAKEVVAGMLDLRPSLWRRPSPQSLAEQTGRADALKRAWQPFDWTERARRVLNAAD